MVLFLLLFFFFLSVFTNRVFQQTLGKFLASRLNRPQPPILEPSAGTGNLIEAFCKAHSYNRWSSGFSEKDFHCVEIDAERAAVLKGKELNVVWDDFLTFNPLMPYQTIIMNPPFHDGAKHFLKAWNILADSGQIACLLNAETIKNPYTDERKNLIQQLENAKEYSVDYYQEAFEGIDVEVALIYAKKKPAAIKSVTFENFKKSVVAERQQTDPQALSRYGEIDALIDNYNAEVKTALNLYDEICNYNQVSIHSDYNEVFKIEVKGHGKGHVGIVKAINYNYWYKLLYSKELSRLLTADAQREYSSKLREMEEFEFNERNILQLKADLTKNLFGTIDAAIMKVWDNFTSRFHWREGSPNIHYYNGWKTNKAFKCNKKVIIPLYAFDHIGNRIDLFRVSEELADIEKAMNYLDCGRTESHDMATVIQQAKEQGTTRNIDTRFFKVDIFKKNTCHLTFKDEALLKKFNLYCGRKLRWLPDDYGYKPYEALDDEERAVADSFEGRDSYEHTFNNRSFFLQTNNNLLLLTSGVSIHAPRTGCDSRQSVL